MPKEVGAIVVGVGPFVGLGLRQRKRRHKHEFVTEDQLCRLDKGLQLHLSRAGVIMCRQLVLQPGEPGVDDID